MNLSLENIASCIVRGGWPATLDDYLNTVEKLFVIENVKATNLNIKLKTAIRTKSKLELVDPSIATAILDLSPSDLIHDLNYFGFLTEFIKI